MLLVAAVRLPAQVRDTLGPDSLPPDTVDYTARYLQAQSRVEELAPVLPRLAAPGPRPALTWLVFDRDSLEWGNLETVGDLLAAVPGVYLWRGGWIGRPEPVNYQGRGATSAEYYLDGVPFVPAGVDSVGVDPALFALSFLDRVEVERWPGLLRVHLFTRRHDRVAPWSRLGVARGDGDLARYQGALQRRFKSGLGFTVAGELLDAPTATGTRSGYKNTQVWVQGGYVPSPRLGFQYQLVGMRPDREPYVVGGTGAPDTIGLGFDASRTDAQFRGFWRAREDGLGAGVDLIYARTGWDGGGIKQQVNQLGGVAALRAPTASLTGTAFYRTRWTSLDLRGNAGWTPTGFFAASAEAGYQRHDGGRSSNWVGLQAGLVLPGGFSLTGGTRLGDVVAAPAVATDTAQRVRDFRGELRWESRILAVEGALTRTGEFTPSPYAEFRDVPLLAPVPATTWITGGARLSPVGWLTLDGWYGEPQGDVPVGVPSRHSLVRGTIRSKFLHAFPSGIFEVKLQGSIESWGSGIIGREADGTPIPLSGASFIRSLLQIRLGSFSFYWDRTNLTATDRSYVPGFQIPSYGSTYGVRWDFLN